MQAALSTNIALSDTDPKSWFSGVSNITKWIQWENILSDFEDIGERQLLDLKSKLYLKFLDIWGSYRTSILNSEDSKLNLFAHIISENFSRSPHIDCIRNFKLRNSLTRFRMSAHNLPIETLRYWNVPRELRLCPLCCSSVGDELHFFMDCQQIDILKSRQRLMSANILSQNFNTIENLRYVLRESDPLNLFEISKHVRTIEKILRV